MASSAPEFDEPPPPYSPPKADGDASLYPVAIYHNQQPQPSVQLANNSRRGLTTAYSLKHAIGAKDPVNVKCPFCKRDVRTVVRHQAGVLAWLLCGFLCLFGCWLGCCLIPFCVDGLQDIYHKCPECHRIIGHYTRA